MALRREKKASIITDLPKYYRDEMANRFEPVLHFLINVQRQVDLREEGITMLSLSILIGELQMFYEKKYGVSGDSKEVTKLPPRVFQDYTVGGSLCLICLTCYDKKFEYGWKDFHFDHVCEKKDSESDASEYNTIVRKNNLMCIAIHKTLIDKGILQVPCIYFARFVKDQPTANLEEIINNHGGCITNRVRDATHVVILNDPDKKIKNPDQDYLRTLEINGDKVRVHWWYFPDSYDQWLSQAEIEGKPEPPREPNGAWRVTERFLHDLVKYNEWMNELDYEEDDVEEDNDSAAAASRHDSKGDTSDDTEDDVPIANNNRKRKPDSSPSFAKPAKISKFWKRREVFGDTSSKSSIAPVLEGPSGWPTSNPKGEQQGIRLVHTGGPLDSEEVQAHAQQSNASFPFPAANVTWSNISNPQVQESAYFPYSAPLLAQVYTETKLRQAAATSTETTTATTGVTTGASTTTTTATTATNSTATTTAAPNNTHASQANQASGPQATDSDSSKAQGTQSSSSGVDAKNAISTDDTKPVINQTDTKTNTDNTATPTPRPLSIPKANQILPPHAQWFDPEMVHPHEKKAMHEYFARRSKKKLDMYLKLRNFIVETYAQKPYRRLTLERCLELVDGDSHVTARIHRFLELWGIINHNLTTVNQLNYDGDLNHGYPILAPARYDSLRLNKRQKKGSNLPSASCSSLPYAGAGAGAVPGGGSRALFAEGEGLDEGKSSSEGMQTPDERISGGGVGSVDPRGEHKSSKRRRTTRGFTKAAMGDRNRADFRTKIPAHEFLFKEGVVGVDVDDESDKKFRREVVTGPAIIVKDQPLLKLTKNKSGSSSSSNHSRTLEPSPRCVVTGRSIKGDKYYLRQDRSYIICPEVFHNGEYPSFLSEADFVHETTDGKLYDPTEDASEVHHPTTKLLSKEAQLQLLRAFKTYKDDFDAISDHAQSGSKESAVLSFLRLPILDGYLDQRHLKLTRNPPNASSEKLLPYLKSSKNPLLSQLAAISSKLSPHVSSACAKAALIEVGLIEERLVHHQNTRRESEIQRAKQESDQNISKPRPSSINMQPNEPSEPNEAKDKNSDIVTEPALGNIIKTEPKSETVRPPKSETKTESNLNKHHDAVPDKIKSETTASNSISNESKESNGPISKVKSESEPSSAANAHASPATASTPTAVPSMSTPTPSMSTPTSTPIPTPTPTPNPTPTPKTEGVPISLLQEEGENSIKAVMIKALAAGADKARELALEEERQMRLLSLKMCQVVLQRINIKIGELAKLDNWLKGELDTAKNYKRTSQQGLQAMLKDPAVRNLLRNRNGLDPGDEFGE